MCKAGKTLILTLFCVILYLPEVYAAEPVTINDLIENAQTWDGKEVTITGEAIGEALERGEYTWVNISDGTNAIGLWLPAQDAANISCYGSYNKIGDTVQVTGFFYRACSEHGGDIDIHGSTLEILSKGTVVQEKLALKKVITGVVLLSFALLLLVIYSRVFKEHRMTDHG